VNLIKEINAFYKLDIPGQLSFTAQSLYMALLHVANEIYSRNITPSNPLLMAKTGIRDVKTLEKARQELIELELITYQSNAKSRLAGKYHIVGLEGLLVDNFQKNTGKIPEDTPENFPGDPGKKPPHIQEENIREENNNPLDPPKPIKQKKQAYAEYVFLTPAEHERLLVEYGEADTSRMIEILDNYIGQNPVKNGKRYTDHNRVLRGWVKERLMEEKNKQKVTQFKPKPINSEGLSPAAIINGGGNTFYNG